MGEGAGKDLNRRARLQARALSYGSATPDHSEPYPLCEFCLVLELNVYYQHVLSSFVLSSSSFFSVLRKPSPTAAPCSTTLFSEVGIHWLPGTFRYVLQVVYVLCLYPISYMTALQNTKKFSKKNFHHSSISLI